MEKSNDISDLVSEMTEMGFGIEDCQAAISAGKLNVAEAIEWILKDNSQDSPTLKLKKALGSQFEKSGLGDKGPTKIESSETHVSSRILPDVLEKAFSLPGIESELAKSVLKRDLDEMAKRVAIENAKKEKNDSKKAHADVLKQIAQDKVDRKQKDTNDYGDHYVNSINDANPRVQAFYSSNLACTLQIRCPNNLTLVNAFSSCDTLSDVWQYLKDRSIDCDNMELLQAFPRRLFTDENRSHTVKQLELMPASSLILKPKIKIEPLGGIKVYHKDSNPRFRGKDVSNVEDDSSSDEANWIPVDVGCALQIRCPSGRSLKKKFTSTETLDDVWQYLRKESVPCQKMELMQAFPRRVFTDDHRSCTLKQLDLLPSGCLILKPVSKPIFEPQGGIKRQSMENNPRFRGSTDEFIFFGMAKDVARENTPPNFRSVKEETQNNSEKRDSETNTNIVIAHESHLWGDGQRLGSEANVVQHHQILAGSTAQQRVQNIITPPAIPERCNCLIWAPTVLSLQDVCIKYVVRQMLEYSTLTLNLPSQVGERILQFLMKEKLLRPRHLQKFLSCHLIHLILDCYPYTTNELLNSIRHHTSLLHISLVCCTLINDTGLQCLGGLKKLLTLNLRGCVQITDNCFPVILEFQHLNSLSLEETKITDQGLIKYATDLNTTLQVLNVNRTAITERCLPYLKNIPNLRFLSMDWTKISSLWEFPFLELLEGLSLQATNVPTEDLVKLKQLPRLHWLNVTDMPNVSGDDGLQVLAGMALRFLSLPSRYTTSDVGLSYILGMPLISLDLTNYINISDIGISMLSAMKNLRRLLLSNTKLTDAGLLTLQDLHSLEILYLDRTAVTDVGTVAFIGMPKLQELSLASTRIKGSFLSNGVLNRCVLLTKLNLSRTMIHIKALKNICLPNLSLLNVDGTQLPCDPSAMLVGCPKLKHVSAKNLQTPTNLDLSSDSE